MSWPLLFLIASLVLVFVVPYVLMSDADMERDR